MKDFSLNDFEIIEKIGQGKFSEVFLAKEKQTGFIVSLKVLDKQYLLKNNLKQQIQDEILLHKKVSTHKNIISLYGFFSNEKNLYLIIEYAPKGDLFKLAKQQPQNKFNENQASVYIFQVCNALQFIHQKNIVHRDLKPENIFVSFDGSLKIGDFGLAYQRKMHKKCDSNIDGAGAKQMSQTVNDDRETFCGTMDYISPEMMARKGHNHQVDIWSLGILCFELTTGLTPFSKVQQQQFFKSFIKKNENNQSIQNKLLKIPSQLSRELHDLLIKLLNFNPIKRISFEEILKHPWITKYNT